MSAGAPLADDAQLRVGSNWEQIKAYLLRLATAGGDEMYRYKPILDKDQDLEAGLGAVDEKRPFENNPKQNNDDDEEEEPAPQPKKKRYSCTKRVALFALLAVLGTAFITRSRCGRHAQWDGEWASEYGWAHGYPGDVLDGEPFGMHQDKFPENVS